MDQLCSLALLVFLATLVAIHAVRARAGVHGQVRHVRTDRVAMEGASALLSRGMLESLYAVIAPVGRACERLGLTANAITGLSVLLALFAGAAFAADHLGIGSVFAVAALGSDALDGFVARSNGSASSAGEVIDAAADRYVELSLFTGLAIHLRGDPTSLLIAFAALGGSFMVSYSTAKAEALGVAPPRGSMRRTERGFLLVVGAGLTPLSLLVGAPERWVEAPLLLTLVCLAVGTNISAIGRLMYIVRALRGRDPDEAIEVIEVIDATDAADTLRGSYPDP